MKTAGKVILGIGGCLLLVILIAVIGGAWFWKEHGSEMVEGAVSASAEGKKEGALLDEKGCLDAAMERHRASGKSIASAVTNGVRLRGCLDASTPTADFCQGVPAENNPIELGTWSAAQCASRGFNDPYCPQLYQQVGQYCASDIRERK